MRKVVAEAPPPPKKKFKGIKRSTSLFARGEPMVWFTGGGLALCLFMIVGLLALVIWHGGGTFWPKPLVELKTMDGQTVLGEVTKTDIALVKRADVEGAFSDEAQKKHVQKFFDDIGLNVPPEYGAPGFSLLSWVPEVLLEVPRDHVRTGNFKLTGVHFEWIPAYAVLEENRPEWGVLLERTAWGRFYGYVKAFRLNGQLVATTPPEAWAKFNELHGEVRDSWEERRSLEKGEVGSVNHRLNAARLDLKSVELEHGKDSREFAEADREYQEIRKKAIAEIKEIEKKIAELNTINDGYELILTTTGGVDHPIKLADIVRGYRPNDLGFFGKVGVYFSRWWEFITDEPREANSEGGVWPAIFGTVIMTLIMSLLVVPFGVLAALYLREYAKQGAIVSAVRIAVNNLAGVPSIVFGVFGLGFFCYFMGAGIDELFFAEYAPSPKYAKGGVLWASLTLALLTLPVVIVATEEALAAVPRSQREGSYACGASKWQTIRRIVLPRAAPGIMTGMILAIARGAGEVAPLMLVGASKLAPELPMDGNFPFLHPDRSFMHLGFHIYDVGFQSQNSEAAIPLVYTTTLLLIAIVILLNVVAIWVRAKLRRRYMVGSI